MANYNPSNHYWLVASDEPRVYSSARAAYIPIDDSTYTAWLDAGGVVTRISSEEDLVGVFTQQYPAGWPAIAVRQQRNAFLAQADIEINRLEDNGQPATAMRQYRQALRGVPAQAGFPVSITWPVVAV